MSDSLFDPAELPPRPPEEPAPPGRPRLRLAVRDQVEYREASLDQLIPPDHQVRVVWEAVQLLDLSPWLANFKAVEGHVGRDGTDPHILMALLVYATLQGEASARKMARLCEEHLAYQWICGGVSLNYHTISDFRSALGENWNTLFTRLVGGLMHDGLVTMQRVAQDGMRVRANAGKSSFRRQPTLEECRAEAEAQVQTLQALADQNPEELTRRQKAARERAARERLERVKDAIEQCEELRKQREERSKKDGKPPKEPRTSTTDPDARSMMVANGGYESAVNVQFATDVDSGIIVGVDVTNEGSDSEQLPPMLDQVQERYGVDPQEALVDGGFATKEAVQDAAENHACVVYAPLKQEKKQLEEGKDPYAPKKGDSQAVKDWRARMGTEPAKVIYKLRAQTAEWVNAQCRNHGLRLMPVRGQPKCKIIAILHAITHNLMTALRLRAKAAFMATLTTT
jgi:transposase